MRAEILVDMMTDAKQSIKEKWFGLGTRAAALEGRLWVIFEPSKGVDIVSAVAAFGPGVMPLGT